ncbi:MAG: hypothetical protein JWN76_1521 [Chitinophagaceae bacterium]|nr:hypothetical protein [Chitinophagaceae bacterium]
MNIINKFFLKTILVFSPLYHSLGVNVIQLKKILEIKLLMDDRRPTSIHQAQRKKKAKPVTMATLGTMLMSMVLGLLYLSAFAFGNNITTQLTIYFTFFIFMLASTLISDFTSVLIDVRDNYIILPKPVNDRTVVIARLLHVLIHISKVVLPMAIPGLAYIIAEYNFYGGLVFLADLVLATCFTIFLINALYLLILKFTTPQRFQSIIVFIQIFFTITLYASYQIIPRILGDLENINIDISKNYLAVFAPPFWFAGVWKELYSFKGNTIELAGFILGILLPFLCLFIVIKYLAPSFNAKLSMISSTDQGTSPAEKHELKAKRKSIVEIIAKWFTINSQEKTGFLFTWKLSSRSRDFRMKVYPSIGYLLVYAVMMFIRKHKISFSEFQSNSSAAKPIVLISIYLFSFLLMIAIGQVKYSEKYKASWMYYITPVKQPGEIILGGIKAIIVKFYFPFIILLAIAGIYLFGAAFIPNLVLGFFNQMLIAFSIVYISNPQLPFSIHDSQNKAGNFVRVIFLLLLLAVVGTLHYFLYSIWPAILVLAILSGVATWLLTDAIRKLSWKKIWNEDF